MVFQESFKDVSRKFYGCLQKRKFQGSFKGVPRKIEGCVKVILSGFQVYLKEVQRVCQSSFHFVSRKCKRSFKDVSRKF